MSYCRFSTNDFHCDLYVYAYTGGGYICEVAKYRVVGDVPPLYWPADGSNEEVEKAISAYEAQMAFMRSAQRTPINLPHAGAHFHIATAQELFDRLLFLKDLGYNFPQQVFDAVLAERQVEGLLDWPADEPVESKP